MRCRFFALLGVIAAATWTVSAVRPALPVEQGDPCALERTGVHHSEGVRPWDSSYPRPLGKVEAALVFLSFPDSVPRRSTALLAEDHIPDTRRFFSTASYGRFDFHLIPVHGYMPMPQPSTAYAIARDWAAEPRRRFLKDAVSAADPRVDFGAFDAVFFVADPDAPGVDPDATKIVNLGKPLEADGARFAHIGAIFEGHHPDRYVFAHESAHVFDLPDLYRRPQGDGAAGQEWNAEVGDWDLMGDQRGLAPDPFAWHKWRFGWLDPKQVVCLPGPGALTARLTPVEIPGGTKLVVVRLGRTGAYAVEVRGRYGNDAEACREGVLVYRVRADVPSGQGPIQVVDAHPRTVACHGRSVHPRLADAPFRAGETFHDPSTGVLIRVTEAGGDGGHTVEVTRAW